MGVDENEHFPPAVFSVTLSVELPNAAKRSCHCKRNVLPSHSPHPGDALTDKQGYNYI